VARSWGAGQRVGVASVEAPPPSPHTSALPPLQTALGWMGVGLGAALAVFLLAMVPVLQAVREAVLEVASLVAAVREEVPDTAAAIRLPALEITDTVEEVGSLSSELTGGIRASAQAVTAASHLTTNGAAYVQETVVNEVLPRARRMGKVAGRQAHTVMTRAIEVNAEMDEYSRPVIESSAEATRAAVAKVRKAAVAAKAARALGKVIRGVRGDPVP